MSMPANFPLTIYCGDTYRWQFLIWIDTAKTQPADLTGVAVKAEIRDKPAGKELAEMDCAITLPNIIECTLDPDATRAIRNGVWDLQLTYPSGDVHTILVGPVKCTLDVTDSVPYATPAQLRSVR